MFKQVQKLPGKLWVEYSNVPNLKCERKVNLVIGKVNKLRWAPY